MLEAFALEEIVFISCSEEPQWTITIVKLLRVRCCRKEMWDMKHERKRPFWGTAWPPNLCSIGIFLSLHFGDISFPFEISFEENCQKYSGVCLGTLNFLMKGVKSEILLVRW